MDDLTEEEKLRNQFGKPAKCVEREGFYYQQRDNDLGALRAQLAAANERAERAWVLVHDGDDIANALRGELALERQAKEKAERERDEANKDYEELLAQTERFERWLKEAKHLCGCEYDNAGDCCMVHYPAKKKLESENARLREALEAVEAWNLDWADGLDANVERIKALVRAALADAPDAKGGES